MGNITLPTPVFVAGTMLCLLAGYLVGAVTGPDAAAVNSATVVSYTAGNGTLCLKGGAAGAQEGAEGDTLCGRWRRTEGRGTNPEVGDEFRFVSLVSKADGRTQTVIYGNVVD